jgi:long-chain fatty acid transport protein
MGLKKVLLLTAISCNALLSIAQDPNQQVNLFALGPMSASFVRMPSREWSQEVDAVYYNPAGLTSIREGFSLYVNNQFQITAFNMMAYKDNLTESPSDYSYYPINYAFPTIFGAYKQGRFVFSFGFFPAIGGGGATSIENLPSVEFPVADAAEVSKNVIGLVENSYGIDKTYTNFNYQYDFDSRGVAYSPGAQVGFSFKLTDYLSLALAGRFIYYIVDQDGGLRDLEYVNEDEGLSLSPTDYFTHVARAEPAFDQPLTIGLPDPLPDLELPVSGEELLIGVGEAFGSLLADPVVDAIQSSPGITPIVGLNFAWNDRWYIGLKYEHRTYINLVTKINDGKDGAGLYVEGKEVRADLPGFLSSGLAFQPTSRLTLAAGNRLFFNKRANLNGREQYIKSLYKEFSLSAEYDVFPRFTVSGGATYRTVRFEDEYYTDVDYLLPAFTVAGGFVSDISQRISVEAGLLATFYQERTFYKDYPLFGGQLERMGLDLPEVLSDALTERIRYDVDGKAFVVSVGIYFWMGSIEQNREDRSKRVEELRQDRKERQQARKEKKGKQHPGQHISQ